MAAQIISSIVAAPAARAGQVERISPFFLSVPAASSLAGGRHKTPRMDGERARPWSPITSPHSFCLAVRATGFKFSQKDAMALSLPYSS